MIWLSWRQFRASGALVFGALVILAVLLAVTGPNLVHSYDAHIAACKASGVSPSNCTNPGIKADKTLHVLLTALILVGPALIGIFWGAPLIARELEAGTYRLGWTQSITRKRWLAVKLGVVGLGSVAAAGLLTLMVDWWSSPIERLNGDRFGPAAFGLSGIMPVGYAAFAFALGVTVGVLLRRTVPAMATTLVSYIAIRLGVTYWVRPHLLNPVHADFALNPENVGVGISPAGISLVAQNPQIPNAWVYSSALIDKAGHGPTTQFLAEACPKLAAAVPPAVSGSHRGGGITQAPVGNAAFQKCAAEVATKFHDVVTYQPASRYWAMQGLETAVFVVLALLLGAGCFWWMRHRVA